MGDLLSTANLLNGKLNFKELKLSDYRDLLKCFIGNDISSQLIFTNSDSILEKITDLNLKEVQNLNIVDYFLLLFQVRQISIGDTIFLTVEDDNSQQLKINLKVQNFINQISSDSIKKLFEPEVTDFCKIYYTVPTIQEIMYLENDSNASVYTYFVDKIEFTNITINLKDFSFTERENIIQKIPVKVMALLSKRVQLFIDEFNSLNLISFLNNDMFKHTVPFTFNSQILGFVLKLVYNTSIEFIYDSMFALTKIANFSCTFLDNCTPGEFFLFVKKLEMLNAQEKANSENSSIDILPPINSEAEFGVE